MYFSCIQEPRKLILINKPLDSCYCREFKCSLLFHIRKKKWSVIFFDFLMIKFSCCLQEGSAFSHCTTCKAQFHLRVEFLEDYAWRKIKFRIFVARDVLLVFLAVQTVRAILIHFWFVCAVYFMSTYFSSIY